MLTREQILEIDTYCAEHQVSQQRYLDEHDIPRHQYYVWKRKYRQEDERSTESGTFVQIRPGGEFVSPMMPPAKTSGKAKPKTGTVDKTESFLTVEIRTAATATCTITVTDSTPVTGATTYTKISSLADLDVTASYLIVSVGDDKVFNGEKTGNAVNVTPASGVITDSDNTMAAYEFTLEVSGSNYYWKFNNKYLACDYSNSGNSGTGLRYMDTQSAVTYPFALTVTSDGGFCFSTTQMNSTTSTNQVLYYKTENSGSGPLSFKIGQSGRNVGIHLYKKD